MCDAQTLSCVWLFVTPWMVAHQAPLPIGFSRQNTGVGCHFLLQRIFLMQGLNLSLFHWLLILYHWATWGCSIIVLFWNAIKMLGHSESLEIGACFECIAELFPELLNYNECFFSRSQRLDRNFSIDYHKIRLDIYSIHTNRENTEIGKHNKIRNQRLGAMRDFHSSWV